MSAPIPLPIHAFHLVLITQPASEHFAVLTIKLLTSDLDQLTLCFYEKYISFTVLASAQILFSFFIVTYPSPMPPISS